MQRKPKSNSVVTSQLTTDGRIEFTVIGAGSFVFDPEKAHEDTRARAEYHGWNQRISDGAALGAGALPAAKLERMQRIAEHYQSGSADWNLKASVTGDSGLVVQAMVRGLGKTLEDIETLLARTQTVRNVDRKGALAVWEEAGAVATAISEIRAERAALVATKAKLSASDLEAEMMAEGAEEEEEESAE